MVMPNYDKRMKSDKELQPNDLLNLLPASVNHLVAVFEIPRHEIVPKLLTLKRQGLAHTGGGEIWYPTKIEKE